MGTPKLGRGLTLGLGIESTWGTAVSRTNWLRLISSDIRRGKGVQPRPHLGTYGAASANYRDLDHLTDSAGGTIEWIASYNDSTLLLVRDALGASSISTSGSGTYTHTGTLKEALPVGLTAEIIGGQSGHVFEGGLINRLTMSGRAGELLRCRAEMVFETSGGLTSAGSPTYSSGGAPIIYHQAGNLTHGSLNDTISGFELTIDNNLVLDRREMGSAFIKKPVRGGFQTITLRITRPWDGTTEHAAYLAQTAGDAAITFTGASPLSFAITAHNAQIIDNPLQAISSPGPQEVTFTLQGLSDGSDEGLALTFINENSAATAN